MFLWFLLGWAELVLDRFSVRNMSKWGVPARDHFIRVLVGTGAWKFVGLLMLEICGIAEAGNMKCLRFAMPPTQALNSLVWKVGNLETQAHKDLRTTVLQKNPSPKTQKPRTTKLPKTKSTKKQQSFQDWTLCVWGPECAIYFVWVAEWPRFFIWSSDGMRDNFYFWGLACSTFFCGMECSQISGLLLFVLLHWCLPC